MRKLAPFVFLLCAAWASGVEFVSSPTDSYEVRRARAFALVESSASDAEQPLQALLKERSDDPAVLFRLGLTTMRRGLPLQAGGERKKAYQEAHRYFTLAQQAGSTEPIIATFLATVKPDGSESESTFSQNPKVNDAMRKAEAAFSQRKFDDAIQHYEAALALDPSSYIATLHLGDAYFANRDPQKAVEWFTKAALIEPNRETPYRYKADALLQMRKKDDALNEYLNAIIAEPYNAYAWRGLQNGCQAVLLKPWQMAPKTPVASVKGDGKIVLPQNFSSLDVVYAAARSKWQDDNRSKWEKAGRPYRQSLEEELEALRAIVKIYAEFRDQKDHPEKIKNDLIEVGPSINQLAEIDAGGFLESHVLLFRANADIAQDYAAYRAENRDKIREYLVKYYLHL